MYPPPAVHFGEVRLRRWVISLDGSRTHLLGFSVARMIGRYFVWLANRRLDYINQIIENNGLFPSNHVWLDLDPSAMAAMSEREREQYMWRIVYVRSRVYDANDDPAHPSRSPLRQAHT